MKNIAPQATVKPKLITGIPYAWGFQDGAQGKSEFTGYHLFAGRKLTQYQQGWREGKRCKR